jgi:alkylhydroperoxidase/carboxymuconolactone decarboxylase family protein YurZ
VAGSRARQQPKLEDLIPIAVVIAAGCQPCARRMVTKALSQGSAKRHVQKVLAIVGHMQRQDCLGQAVGPAALARMEKPLAAAKRALAAATAAAAPGAGGPQDAHVT